MVVGLSGLMVSVGALNATFAHQLSSLAVAGVFLLVGTPEFVDVTYELAQFKLNIHVRSPAPRPRPPPGQRWHQGPRKRADCRRRRPLPPHRRRRPFPGPRECLHRPLSRPRRRQVLTSFAVFGTLMLGCAAEGALLLLLFASAHLLEERLTAHAQARRRDLRHCAPRLARRPPAGRRPAPGQLGAPD